MNLLRLIRAIRFLLSTNGAWVDGAEWTRNDTEALSKFLAGETGRRLTSRLRNSSLSMNAQAVQEGSAQACGRAAGYMLVLADIQTLSASSSPQEEHHESNDLTGIEALEHLTP
jgi:hypothetical protein